MYSFKHLKFKILSAMASLKHRKDISEYNKMSKFHPIIALRKNEFSAEKTLHVFTK